MQILANSFLFHQEKPHFFRWTTVGTHLPPTPLVSVPRCVWGKKYPFSLSLHRMTGHVDCGVD